MEILETISETKAGQFAMNVLFIAAVAAITLILARLVNNGMRRLVERQKERDNGIATVLAFTRYVAVTAVYFAGFMIIVNSIPVLAGAVRTLLTAGGVVAVVAGLAAQEALGSVVSGIMILAFKPFCLGDVVRYLDLDISGVIEEITLHHTVIRTYENKRVIIPNSKMNNAIIENADYTESRVCVFLEVGVTYESDIQLAKSLLAEEVARQDEYLDVRTPQQKKENMPVVTVVVLRLDDSAIVLRASLWARDNSSAFALKCSVQEGILKTYAENGIEIAYPHIQLVKK